MEFGITLGFHKYLYFGAGKFRPDVKRLGTPPRSGIIHDQSLKIERFAFRKVFFGKIPVGGGRIKRANGYKGRKSRNPKKPPIFLPKSE